jgi:hypothetical protein
MSKPIAKVWTFPSDSNPSKSYETLQYTDGSTSCNCMGWTRRVAADGSRSCKHTRFVNQGIANSHCTSSHAYNGVQAAPQKIQTTQKMATGSDKKHRKDTQCTTTL